MKDHVGPKWPTTGRKMQLYLEDEEGR